MTGGDYISIGVLAIFALLGLLGSFRFLVRTAVGLAVGAALLTLASANHLPVPSSARRAINDGVVAPTIVRHARSLGQLLGLDECDDQPPPDPAIPAGRSLARARQNPTAWPSLQESDAAQ